MSTIFQRHQVYPKEALKQFINFSSNCVFYFFGKKLQTLRKKLTKLSDRIQVFVDENRPKLVPINDVDYYFQDGVRRVDFVLVYMRKDRPDLEKVSKAIVNRYLNSLQVIGLQFELEKSTISKKHSFIKVYCPTDIIYYFAFLYNIDLEKDNENYYYQTEKKYSLFHTILTKPNPKNSIYWRAPETISNAKPKEPTNAERILVVNKILISAVEGDDQPLFGYQTLISKKHLSTGYPMHDGHYQWTETGPLNDRQLLAKYWGDPWMILKKQPLDLVCKYFGPSVAFYFAWMDFYTKMLAYISFVGVCTFVYGMLTISAPYNIKSKAFCNTSAIICARCPDFNLCRFRFLNESCTNTKMNYVLENSAVIFYAFLLSIWATLFLELWKRRENTLSYRWNLLDVEDDNQYRPQFIEKTKYRRLSIFTNEMEPYIPTRISLLKTIFSSSVILLLSILVVFVLIMVIVFRLFLTYILSTQGTGLFAKYNSILSTVCGSTLAFVFIFIFEIIFERISVALTNFDNPKTDIDFANSISFKMFVLGFVNGFLPLFYLAFIKGRIYNHPGEKFGDIFSMLKSDICAVNGCLIDISIQLTTILLGTSIFRSISEILVPYLMNWFCKRIGVLGSTKVREWEEDYYRRVFKRYFLIFEYKPIILQYGYLTMFAAAFPLSPILAMIYNAIEIRVDAYKMIRMFRRPIPFRVNGIGAWNVILRILTYVSITTNAVIIAFATDFMPRQLHDYVYKDRDYMNQTFSVFATKDYQNWEKGRLKSKVPWLTECIYLGRRHHYGHVRKYTKTVHHVYVTAMEFVTFMLIEHILLGITAVLAYAIPDMPRFIRQRINYQRLQDIEKAESESVIKVQ